MPMNRKKKSFPVASLEEGDDHNPNHRPPTPAEIAEFARSLRDAIPTRIKALIEAPYVDPERMRGELIAMLQSSVWTRQQREEIERFADSFGTGRSTGENRDEERERRALIRQLGDANPQLSAAKLWKHADAAPLRKVMKSGRRFANILSEESPRRPRRR